MNTIQTTTVNLIEKLTARNLTISTAESCTAGGVAYTLTNIPGSSQVFEYGFITYSNHAKQKILHVPAEILLKHGAVSEEVVISMAQGAQQLSKADLTIAISGVAGPDGGTMQKPVGTVWIAWQYNQQSTAKCYHFAGDRNKVRENTILNALQVAYDILK